MKFMTKEWVEKITLASVSSNLKADPKASEMNEEYYQENYQALLKSHIHSELLTWITEESERSIRARAKRFIDNHIKEHMNAFRFMPESLKAKIADLRMLALHIAAPEVYDEIIEFCKSVRRETDEIQKKARQASLEGENASTAGKELKKMAEQAKYPELYSFNEYFQDERIQGIKWDGKDLRVCFMPDDDGNPAQDILITDAEILKQDRGDISEAYWYESETYCENGQFELHMLFSKGATPSTNPRILYLTVRVSDIQLPN